MSLRSPHDSSRSAPAAPTRLRPYLLEEQLGQGELSTVYAALRHDAGLDEERVAIKLLHARHIQDEACRTALKKEAELGGLAASPSRVFSYVAAGRPYVVLERIDGADLGALLVRSRRLGSDPLRCVRTVLHAVLGELQSLHDGSWASQPRPLVHRAPSARHILVGRDGRVSLTDFTHAVGEHFPRLPESEQRLKLEDMAPEQLEPEALDQRCDLFVVGLVLWTALTGTALPSSRTRELDIEGLRARVLSVPDRVGDTYREGLKRVCLRALMRARAARYMRADEMASHLWEAAQPAGGLATHEEVGEWVSGLLKKRALPPPAAQLSAHVVAQRLLEARTQLPAGPPLPSELELPLEFMEARSSKSTLMGFGELELPVVRAPERALTPVHARATSRPPPRRVRSAPASKHTLPEMDGSDWRLLDDDDVEPELPVLAHDLDDEEEEALPLQPVRRLPARSEPTRRIAPQHYYVPSPSPRMRSSWLWPAALGVAAASALAWYALDDSGADEHARPPPPNLGEQAAWGPTEGELVPAQAVRPVEEPPEQMKRDLERLIAEGLGYRPPEATALEQLRAGLDERLDDTDEIMPEDEPKPRPTASRSPRGGVLGKPEKRVRRTQRGLRVFEAPRAPLPTNPY